jgi:SAM-dependent methyltransferase
MTRRSYAEFYAREYTRLYGGVREPSTDAFEQAVRKGRAIASFLKPRLQVGTGTKVLEVGCGTGGILRAFQTDGAECAGCDWGGGFLARGRARGLHLIEGDVSVLKPYAPADLIILNHVVEHFTDFSSEMSMIRSLLKETGLIYVAVPGLKRLHCTCENDLLLFLRNAHVYHFSATTLAYHMGRAGFRLLSGDERIQAVFCLAATVSDSEPPAGEYDEVVRYLDEVERKRKTLLPIRAARKSLYRATRAGAVLTGAIHLYRWMWKFRKGPCGIEGMSTPGDSRHD